MKYFIRFYSFLSIVSIGCSEPFEVDRHDLITPRVLGVRLADSGHFVQVWNGEGPWHDESPSVDWYNNDGIKLGESVYLPTGVENPTSLIYTDPVGGEHLVQFDLLTSTMQLSPLLYDLGTVNDLDLDSRLENLGEPWIGGIAPEALRIEIKDDEFVNQGRLRWMSSFGKGTFLERSAFETDFFQSDILMDRDEVVRNIPLDFEHTSVFALYVDGFGSNQWTWMDLWSSALQTIEVSGRSIPINGDLSDDWSGDNVAFLNNQTETGFGWSLTPTDVEVEPLSCALDDGPFQWMWIETGLCTIADVEDQIILLGVQ